MSAELEAMVAKATAIPLNFDDHPVQLEHPSPDVFSQMLVGPATSAGSLLQQATLRRRGSSCSYRRCPSRSASCR